MNAKERLEEELQELNAKYNALSIFIGYNYEKDLLAKGLSKEMIELLRISLSCMLTYKITLERRLEIWQD